MLGETFTHQNYVGYRSPNVECRKSRGIFLNVDAYCPPRPMTLVSVVAEVVESVVWGTLDQDSGMDIVHVQEPQKTRIY
jgi:hypothetical protein